MQRNPGFCRFVALDERDAPDLLLRATRHELPVDGERYGVFSRFIARPEATVVDLATAVVRKLCEQNGAVPSALAGIVLSSRIHNIETAAAAVGDRLNLQCEADGIERACSGFPAATERAVAMCRQLDGPVAIVTAEIMSRSINWEPVEGDPADHARARGQASKLFGDGAAAVVVAPDGPHEILDAWAWEVADEKQLIQKIAIDESMDPWGRVRPGETECMSMPGRRGWYLLRTAPKIMLQALQRSLQTVFSDSSGVSVDHVVPHQANGLMMPLLEKQLAATEWGRSATVWNCIGEMGNTVSATIPTAMAQIQDKLPARAILGMPSAGAGGPGYRPDVLSTGCVLVRTGAKVR